ncbi:MAG: hypothetical protein WC227_00210 [Patescibacteria group bacterium]|jgi:hypothetical protein
MVDSETDVPGVDIGDGDDLHAGMKDPKISGSVVLPDADAPSQEIPENYDGGQNLLFKTIRENSDNPTSDRTDAQVAASIAAGLFGELRAENSLRFITSFGSSAHKEDAPGLSAVEKCKLSDRYTALSDSEKTLVDIALGLIDRYDIPYSMTYQAVGKEITKNGVFEK